MMLKSDDSHYIFMTEQENNDRIHKKVTHSFCGHAGYYCVHITADWIWQRCQTSQ